MTFLKTHDHVNETISHQSKLLNNISDYIFTHDMNGIFIHADFSRNNLLGYLDNELDGKNIKSIISDEYQHKFNDYINRISTNGFDEGYLKIKAKDGSSLFFWYSNTVAMVSGAKVVTGVARDITSSMKIKNDLKNQKRQLKDLLKTMVDGYFELDLAGNFTFVNQSLVSIMGYNKTELSKMNYKEYTTTENSRIIKKMFKGVYKTGRTGYVVEYEVIRKNGSIATMETSATIIRNITGEPVGFRGIARDITEKKAAEKAVMENQAKLWQIIQGNSIPTFVIDADSRVQHWNKACEKLTGIPRVKIKNSDKHWQAFYKEKRPTLADLIVKNASPDDYSQYYPSYHKRSKIAAGAYESEVFLPEFGSDGKWLFITAAPLKDSRGNITGALETIQDITVRKKAEIFLKQQHDILEEKVANRTKDLEDTNTALKVLLKNRENDQKKIEEVVVSNIRETVLPYMEKLKNSNLKKNQQEYLDIIMENMNDIISPLMQKMSLEFIKLTPAEIQVANLIKLGKSTKTIADILNLSPRTIEFHRDNLRKKTGIKNRRINLRSYLLSLENN